MLLTSRYCTSVFKKWHINIIRMKHRIYANHGRRFFTTLLHYCFGYPRHSISRPLNLFRKSRDAAGCTYSRIQLHPTPAQRIGLSLSYDAHILERKMA